LATERMMNACDVDRRQRPSYRPWCSIAARSRSDSRQRHDRPMAAVAPFRLESSYARDLQGFSVPWRPEAVPAPKSLFFNAPLAEELGLDVAALAGAAGADVFAGNEVPEGA